MLLELTKDIKKYKNYLYFSTLKEIKKRYKRSYLGILWSLLSPLIMMCILTVVFSTIFKSTRGDYSVFILTGMLTFNIFQESVNYSLSSIANNLSLIKQQPVPKILFILNAILISLFNFFISLIPLFFVILLFGKMFGINILFIPIVILPIVIFSIGVSLVVSVLNVFYEDTRHLTELSLTGLYFLCPVLYSVDFLSPDVLKYLSLNPLFNQIEFVRSVVIDNTFPDLKKYLLNLSISIVVFLFGYYFFRKNEDKFIYYV